MNATYGPIHEQSRTLLVEYDMTKLRGSICGKDDMLQEHHTVHDYVLGEHVRASIHYWAEVKSQLEVSSREMLAKRIVDILHSENFELSGTRKTLRDFSVYFRFLRKRSNESLPKIGF